MDLLEFSQWLEAEMERQGIPGDAEVHWIDIGNAYADSLELEYDEGSNSVTISQI